MDLNAIFNSIGPSAAPDAIRAAADVDARVSAVNAAFPDLVALAAGRVEFRPTNPTDPAERLAWLWLVRPDLQADLLAATSDPRIHRMIAAAGRRRDLQRHLSISAAERRLARDLRPMLETLPDGADIPAESPAFREVLVALEFFLPQLLREIHPEWTRESLDGVVPLHARKCGPLEAEIFGLCHLISDQTTTPLRVRFQLEPTADEVAWLDCRLGENGPAGMIRDKFESNAAVTRRLHALEGRADSIPWTYQVTFGHRTDPLADAPRS